MYPQMMHVLILTLNVIIIALLCYFLFRW